VSEPAPTKLECAIRIGPEILLVLLKRCFHAFLKNVVHGCIVLNIQRHTYKYIAVTKSAFSIKWHICKCNYITHYLLP
jgi:hypothetical protein